MTLLLVLITIFSASIVVSVSLIQDKLKPTLGKGNRYVAIDGLRGYLALLVFIQHYILTYTWIQGGEWGDVPEFYSADLGKFGVTIFFMITGFLFTNKLLNCSGQVSWVDIYISRVFRIFPLYLFSVVLILSISLLMTGFVLEKGLVGLAFDVFKWLHFHGSSINGYEKSRLINAGVEWSLKYEWVFYCLLPLISVLLRRNIVIQLFILFIFLYLYLIPLQIIAISSKYFLLFYIGSFSAYLERSMPVLKGILVSKYFSFVIVGVVLAYWVLGDRNDLLGLLIMSILFLSTCYGNDFFGSLKWRQSICLGEISYSIYLIHGIVLFAVLSFDNVSVFSKISFSWYMLMLPALTILVVLFSLLTYLFIESFGVEYGRRIRKNKNCKWR